LVQDPTQRLNLGFYYPVRQLFSRQLKTLPVFNKIVSILVVNDSFYGKYKEMGFENCVKCTYTYVDQDKLYVLRERRNCNFICVIYLSIK
jgi:hypothetical protein